MEFAKANAITNGQMKKNHTSPLIDWETQLQDHNIAKKVIQDTNMNVHVKTNWQYQKLKIKHI
jgi:hypothetical protein